MLETLAPVRALFNTRQARGELAERLLIEQGRGMGYQVEILELPRFREEVPLGWMLSQDTRDNIDACLQEPAMLKEVGCWLRKEGRLHLCAQKSDSRQTFRLMLQEECS